MIPWETIETGLLQLVTDVTGVAAEWEGREGLAISDETMAVMRLSVSGSVPYGLSPERKITWTEDEGEILSEGTETTEQLHKFTLRVKCMSLSDSPGRSAIHRLEQLRGAMHRDSVRTVLRSLGLGFARSLALLPIPETHDGRFTSHAALDLRLNAKGSDTDPVKLVDIRRVEITPTINGNPLPPIVIQKG